MVGVKILYKLATSLAVHNMGFLKGECSKGGREEGRKGGREGGWAGGRAMGGGRRAVEKVNPLYAITFCQWYLETHLSRHVITGRLMIHP